MTHDDRLHQLHTVLVTDWALPETVLPTMEQFLNALAERVRTLLNSDVNRLTTAMYTLDIDEERFNTAMHLPGLDMKCLAVAELILHREVQKIESRMRYEAMKRGDQPSIDVDGA